MLICIFIDILGQVHDHEGPARPAPAAHRMPEVCRSTQAVIGGQHPVAGPQTARLLRPLRRRADRIERPARVRIRRRKPCTLCRRRLFGWYVRLLTSSSPGRCRGRPKSRSHDARGVGGSGAASHATFWSTSEVRTLWAGGCWQAGGTSRTGSTCQRYADPGDRVNSSCSTGVGGQNHRSSQELCGKSSRHAGTAHEPVENRLLLAPAVVSVRRPGTSQTWESRAHVSAPHPAHPVDKGVDRDVDDADVFSWGFDLRGDVSDEGSARRTWSQQRTVESSMSWGPPSWTAWLPTSACGSRRASR
jgi:hypothetical protein